MNFLDNLHVNFILFQRARETGEIYSSGSGSEGEVEEGAKKEPKKRLVFTHLFK
jgi:phosphoribosyl 1,2-cyclic phosphodiesterase